MLAAMTAAVALLATAADAQQAAQGFAVERFSPAPAGAGWLAMDALDMGGPPGGAVQLTTSWAHRPLVVTSADGTHELALVSDQATADFGVAATWGRLRLSLDFPMPLVVAGASGAIDGYRLTAPAVDPGNNPDSIAEGHLGLTARLYGASDGALRLGASAELVLPTDASVRADYITDGTPRAFLRVLAAGDVGSYRYAANLGVHVRPLDDWPAPGSPHGSEVVFGAGAARAFAAGAGHLLVVGPEVFGETALRALFGKTTTGVEGLLSARYEETGEGTRWRFKLGAGGGLDAQFGAPQWRVVAAAELFGSARASP